MDALFEGPFLRNQGKHLAMKKRESLCYRIAPLEMTPSEFRRAGRQLVERIAEFLCTFPTRPVVPNESPNVIREALDTAPLPEEGAEAKDLLEEAATLLFEHSTFNGHPRFWEVITSSAAPSRDAHMDSQGDGHVWPGYRSHSLIS